MKNEVYKFLVSLGMFLFFVGSWGGIKVKLFCFYRYEWKERGYDCILILVCYRVWELFWVLLGKEKIE